MRSERPALRTTKVRKVEKRQTAKTRRTEMTKKGLKIVNKNNQQ